MGNLTDDMTRLRGEVDALRNSRGALMQELTHGANELAANVAAMRADFAAAHAAMARKTGEERNNFVAAVISEVNALLGAFSRDREDMARKGIHDRGVYLTEMRRQVTGMCKETADDMMGARLAWRGQSSRKSPPVQPKSLQLKKEPEFVAPVTPPLEAMVKKTVPPPEFMAEKPPASLKEPVKKEEEKKVTLTAPALDPPKVKLPPPVFAAPELPKQKEKSRLDEKPAKTATKGRRSKK